MKPLLLCSLIGLLASPALAQQPVQRGDVSIGYVFMHEDSLSLPMGLAGSDAWRVHPNIDVVIESAFAHGTADFITTKVGVNIWTLQGGVRVSGGSRYGESVHAFGQILGGIANAKGSIGSIASTSSSGLAVSPGFGVEVPVSRVVAIRPQFDVLLTRIDSSWGKDIRFNVNAVFRLFK